MPTVNGNPISSANKRQSPNSLSEQTMEDDATDRTSIRKGWNRYILLGSVVVISIIVAMVLAVTQPWNSSSSKLSGDDEQQGPAKGAPAPTVSPSPPLPSSEPPRVSKLGYFELLETVPHDPSAFTQGLFLWNDTLYEGTGNYGESYVRIVDLPTGSVLKQVALEASLFGEGIAHYPTEHGESRIVQITYKEQTGIIWDMDLNRLHTFSYETTTSEGWGITYAESHGLLVSDGSEWIMVWDPTNLSKDVDAAMVTKSRRFQVKLLYKGAKEPQILPRVNEMEWDTHSKTLLANVWIQDVLVRIDIDSGHVTQIYDMQQLWPDRPRNVDVFNGVAITDEPNVVWVTGKWWPNMYRVRLIDA